jgi:hypothetical protein
MNEILQKKSLVNVAESKVVVTGIKATLEQGWQKKVEDFVPLITHPALVISALRE